MDIAVLTFGDADDPRVAREVAKAARALSLSGFTVTARLFVPFGYADAAKTLEYLSQTVKAVVVFDGRDEAMAALQKRYELPDNSSIVDADGVIYAFSELRGGGAFVADELIPALNSRMRTYYETFIINTFGQRAENLREILKEYVKNRSKVEVSFFESGAACEVRIRYSSRTLRAEADAVIDGCKRLTEEFTYAYGGVSLAERAAQLLLSGGHTLSIAESFTGGGIASALVSVPGISAALTESIVAYSNGAKSRRLGIDKRIIEENGAVSVETVYEMAANVLLQSGSTFSVASTGNAGPSAEKDGEQGLCYIAVGSMSGVHIYKHLFETGSRSGVTERGVQAALFHLIKNIAKLPRTAE